MRYDVCVACDSCAQRSAHKCEQFLQFCLVSFRLVCVCVFVNVAVFGGKVLLC